MMTALNQWAGANTPHWIWDWVQIVVGGLGCLFAIGLRIYTKRMQTASIHDRGSARAVRIGQVGNVIVATLSLILFIDGWTPPPSPPRVVVVVTLMVIGSVMIQYGALYLAFYDKPST